MAKGGLVGTMKNDDAGKAANSAADVPPVPLTLEGWSILHQMFRIRWTEWYALTAKERQSTTDEAVGVFGEMENGAHGRSGARHT